jgi:hypothetical protein
MSAARSACVCVPALCVVLALATSAAAEEPKGFSKWPWGTTKQVLRTEFLLPECNYMIGSENTGLCRQYRVADIQVQLTLNFQPDGTLSGYSMAFASAEFATMRDTVIEKFGPPTSTISRALEWRWPSGTSAVLADNLGQAILDVSTKRLADFRRKEEEEKKQERKRRF